MIRGTTPTHVFKTSIDLTTAVEIFITYKQMGAPDLEKSIDDITVTEKEIKVRLTQEDTLAFKSVGKVKMQVRAKFPDGTAVACKVIERPVGEILKEGII